MFTLSPGDWANEQSTEGNSLNPETFKDDDLVSPVKLNEILSRIRQLDATTSDWSRSPVILVYKEEQKCLISVFFLEILGNLEVFLQVMQKFVLSHRVGIKLGISQNNMNFWGKLHTRGDFEVFVAFPRN